MPIKCSLPRGFRMKDEDWWQEHQVPHVLNHYDHLWNVQQRAKSTQGVHHKNTQEEEEIAPLKWQLGSMGVRKTSFNTIQHETC